MRNPSGSSSVAAAAAAAATTRTKTPCCSKIGLKRGPWTPEEDELLSNYIKKEGEGRWRTLPKRAGLLRCGKSCRLRWMNYLRPSVKRGQIAPDEEDLILRLHRLLGNRWSLIAGRIPGRTDNEIKNYWNTHLSKKLISQGIDPRTHKPLNPIIESGHQDQLKASSSKAAANHRKPQSPKPNPPVSSGNLEETTSGSTPIISNKENNENLQNTNQAHYHSSSTAGNAVPGGYASLLNGDGCDNEDNEDLNYCTDDIFSSFLNSLINEEAFTGQQHQMQEVLPNVITAPISDPLVSSVASSAFGFGTGWESAIMSSTSFDQSGSRRVDGHVE